MKYNLILITLLIMTLNMKEVNGNHQIRVYGVKIKVTDMDKATNFYCEIMGFEIESRELDDKIILKTAKTKLILEKTRNNHFIDFPNEAQTILVFRVKDINAKQTELIENGVEFVTMEKKFVGPGYALKFRDPFGNVHSLMETTDKSDFDEPAIYNVGYYLKDMNLAREFWCGKFGMLVMTESYYPPSIPLLHPDKSFGFMLHDGNYENAKYNYPDDTQSIIVFSVSDLSETISWLKYNSIKIITSEPIKISEGSMIAIEDPFGNVAEIVELNK